MRVMTKSKWKTSFVVILSFLIILNVAFIFYQSALPPAVSGAESESVKGFFVRLFGGEDTLLGGFFARYTRKIAHFAEFALLGLLSAALCRLLGGARRWWLHFPFGLLIASLDETLQHFTGRGPAILDVGIDYAGYLSATLFFYVCCCLIGACRLRKLRKEKRNV